MLMNTWQDPVPDIIQRFLILFKLFILLYSFYVKFICNSRFTKPPDHMNALIEFLTILPEEINNKRLKLGQNRRDQLKSIFKQSSFYIIQFLEVNLKSYLENASKVNTNSKMRLIYKCFASWIEEKLIEPQLIVNHEVGDSYLQPFAYAK